MVFGGVAWAQNRGVRAVEVRIDDGGWQPAELGASYSTADMAVVELPLAGENPWETHHHGASYRQHRSHSNGRSGWQRPRRRHRLAHGGLHRGGEH